MVLPKRARSHAVASEDERPRKKRSRIESENDDDGEEEFDQPQTKRKNKGKQRAVVSQASDDESGSDNERETQESASENEESYSEEEEEDIGMTQEEFEANEKVLTNFADENAGIVTRIECENFMCHEFLKIDLREGLNFIVGQNGSGKSAIFAALLVTLGARAGFTGRGNSLKEMIKENAPSAVVRVHLRNRGPDAYRHDDYGDTIVLERRIARDGSGGYRLKSKDGVTISNSKEELTKITDHWNIQADNPLNFLTQETAKSFLAKATAEDLWEMFMRGTSLRTLEEDYQQLDGYCKILEQKVKLLHEGTVELKKKKTDLQTRFQAICEADDKRDELKQLEREYTWALVREQEDKLAGLMADKDRLTQKLNRAREEAESKAAELEAKKVERSEKADEINDRATRIFNPYHREFAAVKQSLQAVEREIAHNSNDVLDIKEQIRNKDLEIQTMERNIMAECQKAQNQDIVSRREETLRQIEDYRGQIDSSSSDMQRLLSENDELRSRFQEVLRRKHDAQNRVKESENRVLQIRRSISQATDAKKDRLIAFHPKMPLIIADIKRLEAEGRWTGEVPLGPFGMYVELKERKWFKVIESVMGVVLNSFSVQTREDADSLLEIVERHQASSAIDIYRLEANQLQTPMAYHTGEPDRQYLTILRALEIKNDVVLRQLILNRKVEGIVLIEERADADDVSTSNGGRYPHGFVSIYTLNGYQVGSRQGGFQTQTLRWWTKGWRLVQDSEDSLRQLHQELEATEAMLQESQTQLDQASYELQTLDNSLRQNQTRRNSLESQKTQLERQIRSLQDSLEEQQPANISALENAKHQLEHQKEQFVRQLEEYTRSSEDLKKRRSELKAKVAEMAQTLESYGKQHASSEREYQALDNEIRRIQSHVDHYTQKVQENELLLQQLEPRVETQRLEVEQSCQNALDYCEGERLEPNMGSQQYELEINRINRFLQDRDREFGSKEHVEAELGRITKLYKAKRKEWTVNETLNVLLKEVFQRRLDLWFEFRDIMSYRARNNFISLLNKRGYRGSLKFKHTDEQLHVHVQVEDETIINRYQGSKKKVKQGTKSLSGGEKSFSTVCLLLSIWNMMASPIRCLDEFDVFMDAANRRMTMTLIRDSRKEATHGQYILITPQDASGFRGMDLVHVFKMPDPIRGQMRLNFRQGV